MSAEGRPARETRTLNSRKSREEKEQLGKRFVMDLAMALKNVIDRDLNPPSDISSNSISKTLKELLTQLKDQLIKNQLISDTSSAFISAVLTKLADSLPGLSEEEKQEIKTDPTLIQKWLYGRDNPTPKKVAVIRELLIKIDAPPGLIPEEDFFNKKQEL